MARIADLLATTLGVVAACLLAVATASTCSVALADVTPDGAVAYNCDYSVKLATCTWSDETCPDNYPVCYYTNLEQNACGCLVKKPG